jgi:hypothetical protein
LLIRAFFDWLNTKKLGLRLALQMMLKLEALHRLIYDYPSHSFVIDRSEAKQFIFESVREPDEQEKQLALECHKTPQFNNNQEIVIHNVTKKCL